MGNVLRPRPLARIALLLAALAAPAIASAAMPTSAATALTPIGAQPKNRVRAIALGNGALVDGRAVLTPAQATGSRALHAANA